VTIGKPKCKWEDSIENRFQKWGVGLWTGLSRQCEYDNKPSSSIKGKEFPENLFRNLMEQSLSSETSSWLPGHKIFSLTWNLLFFFCMLSRSCVIHCHVNHVNMFQVNEFLQEEVYPILEQYKGKTDKPAILEI
jgi:hypothetical protein